MSDRQDDVVSAECAACAERKEQELAELEQWKQEFAARHGLTDALRRHQQQHENE